MYEKGSFGKSETVKLVERFLKLTGNPFETDTPNIQVVCILLRENHLSLFSKLIPSFFTILPIQLVRCFYYLCAQQDLRLS